MQRPSQVLAPTGTRQVGSMTSAERGELVTVCAAVNAYGKKVPAMLIVPRVIFRQAGSGSTPHQQAGSSYDASFSQIDVPPILGRPLPARKIREDERNEVNGSHRHTGETDAGGVTKSRTRKIIGKR